MKKVVHTSQSGDASGDAGTHAPLSLSSLTPNDQAVLRRLARSYYSEGNYLYFRTIQSWTGLSRREVRLSCRRLARKGLAQYSRTLWGDNGPAGAGYAATRAGHDLVEPPYGHPLRKPLPKKDGQGPVVTSDGDEAPGLNQ